MRTEIKKAAINGLQKIGYEIFGDSFIGYRAFNYKGDELDIEEIHEFGKGLKVDDEILSELDKVKKGGYNECIYWV